MAAGLARASRRARWERLLPRGSNPAPRSSHTVTSVGGRVCVFGGEDAPRNAFDPVPHFLDPAEGAWRPGGALAPGPPRLGHGAAALGRRLHVFGGRLGGPNDFSGKDSGESGDHFTLDTDTDRWTRWQPAAPGAAAPAPRSFHAMCAWQGASGGGDDGLVFLFGGCGSTGRLNDLWSFDASRGEWACLHAGGASDAPLPRGGAALVASPDGARLALLFGFSGAQQGDIAIFDRRAGRWQICGQDQQSGDVPSPRSVLAASAVPGSDDVFVFGGECIESDLGHAGAGEFVADLHALELGSMAWRRVEAEGPAPEPRGWAGMAAPDPQQLVLFGGLNAANQRLGDTWKLVLE